MLKNNDFILKIQFPFYFLIILRRTMMKINNTPYDQILSHSEDDKLQVFSFKNYPLKNIAIGLSAQSPNFKIENRLIRNFDLLEYIVDGKGILKIEDANYNIEKGMTIFIPSNHIHSIIPDEKSPLKIIWVAYTCNYFELMVREFYIKGGCYFIDSQLDFLSLQQLLEYKVLSDIVFITAKTLHEILIKLAITRFTSNVNTLDELKNKIDSLIYSKGNLNEVIDTIGVSKSALIKYFNKTYGISPYQYLLDKKLKIAKDYLTLTTIPIKTIAHMLAFSEEHYFCYIFKKKNGLTPLEFRQKYTNNN